MPCDIRGLSSPGRLYKDFVTIFIPGAHQPRSRHSAVPLIPSALDFSSARRTRLSYLSWIPQSLHPSHAAFYIFIRGCERVERKPRRSNPQDHQLPPLPRGTTEPADILPNASTFTSSNRIRTHDGRSCGSTLFPPAHSA